MFIYMWSQPIGLFGAINLSTLMSGETLGHIVDYVTWLQTKKSWDEKLIEQVSSLHAFHLCSSVLCLFEICKKRNLELFLFQYVRTETKGYSCLNKREEHLFTSSFQTSWQITCIVFGKTIFLHFNFRRFGNWVLKNVFMLFYATVQLLLTCWFLSLNE